MEFYFVFSVGTLLKALEEKRAGHFACQFLLSSFCMSWVFALWQNQQSECAPSEDSDQPGHPPSVIRVFTVRIKKACTLSYPLSAPRRLWSDWADAQADDSEDWSDWAAAQADLSLRWAHSHIVGFVTRQLNLWFLFLSVPQVGSDLWLWHFLSISHFFQSVIWSQYLSSVCRNISASVLCYIITAGAVWLNFAS